MILVLEGWHSFSIVSDGVSASPIQFSPLQSLGDLEACHLTFEYLDNLSVVTSNEANRSFFLRCLRTGFEIVGFKDSR